MLIFVGYYAYWRWKSNKMAIKIEKENITAGDYSIYVTNLPE